MKSPSQKALPGDCICCSRLQLCVNIRKQRGPAFREPLEQCHEDKCPSRCWRRTPALLLFLICARSRARTGLTFTGAAGAPDEGMLTTPAPPKPTATAHARAPRRGARRAPVPRPRASGPSTPAVPQASLVFRPDCLQEIHFCLRKALPSQRALWRVCASSSLPVPARLQECPPVQECVPCTCVKAQPREPHSRYRERGSCFVPSLTLLRRPRPARSARTVPRSQLGPRKRLVGFSARRSRGNKARQTVICYY